MSIMYKNDFKLESYTKIINTFETYQDQTNRSTTGSDLKIHTKCIHTNIYILQMHRLNLVDITVGLLLFTLVQAENECKNSFLSTK